MITTTLTQDAEPTSGSTLSQCDKTPGTSAIPASSSPTITRVPSPLSQGQPSMSGYRPASPSAPIPSPADISILDKLVKTCPIWLQLGISETKATHILEKEAPGIFLVRRDIHRKRMILSVRLFNQEGTPQVKDMLIKEEKSLMYLEDSILVFDNIFKLIAFYCVSRDILPFTLRLPKVIVQASKYEHMEIISSLGSDFWGSSLNRRCGHFEGGRENSETDSQDVLSSCHNRSSCSLCDVEQSVVSGRQWYINPVFVEEYNTSQLSEASIARSQSLTLPGTVEQSRHWRRTAFLQRPFPPPELCPTPRFLAQPVKPKEEEDSSSYTVTALGNSSEVTAGAVLSLQGSYWCPEFPSLGFSEQCPWRPAELAKVDTSSEEELNSVCVSSVVVAGQPFLVEVRATPKESAGPALMDSKKGAAVSPDSRKKLAPIPPPRKNRLSRIPVGSMAMKLTNLQRPQKTPDPMIQKSSSQVPMPSASMKAAKDVDISSYSCEGGVPRLDLDHTSSTEEEAESAGSVLKPNRQNSTLMISKAKKRLSRVNLSHMFTGLMCAEKKLRHRIVDLTEDQDSYFGNLVLDFRAFTLEAMQKQMSSTKMLQEIRQMMTQLKGYLIQSTELQAILESSVYPEEKLESIIEAALFKCVLKPLRDAIYVSLWDLHTRDNSLMKLRDNQQVVLNTTTTDLGVTTSVPEAADLEKIKVKLDLLHKEYSPERKISTLLKTCKVIYESMSVSCPGRTLGADDFLPVLMYVVAHSNIESLMLDVEYMMELMDPAMQLGEGSYYLTTTYGALEHIKNYDILPMTRQFSLEVQDSIRHWERRRTLNKTDSSGSMVQDFIKISFLETAATTKTLGVRDSTTVQDLCSQCAETFEVREPDAYRLYVLVDGKYRALAPEELPLSVKSDLHHSEHHTKYRFVYRLGISESKDDIVPVLISPTSI